MHQKKWFKPEISGAGPRFCGRWSGPDKVVQTGENWYFQTAQKTSPIWFRPLLLVQTTKTWSIPSFSRLLRAVPRWRAPPRAYAAAARPPLPGAVQAEWQLSIRDGRMRSVFCIGGCRSTTTYTIRLAGRPRRDHTGNRTAEPEVSRTSCEPGGSTHVKSGPSLTFPTDCRTRVPRSRRAAEDRVGPSPLALGSHTRAA